MRKMICILLALACILTLDGCGKETAISSTGLYLDKEQDLLYVYTDTATFAFCIDANTEFVWEDERMLECYENGVFSLFWSGCQVEIVPGPERKDMDFTEDAAACYYAKKIIVTQSYDEYDVMTEAKPVIYLYPESRTDVTVGLDYDGTLTCTYPAYQTGWSVTADPDGTLIDSSGQTYNYLYWEGISGADYDFSRGFCVAGADTAAFLEDARARLNISPTPDTLIRVFMACKPLREAVEIEPQALTAPERNGFTVVEWGDTKMD